MPGPMALLRRETPTHRDDDVHTVPGTEPAVGGRSLDSLSPFEAQKFGAER